MSQQLPDPSTEAVKIWLKGLKTADLQSQGWTQVNQRFHGVAMSMRTYLNERFPDPKERAAAFDGLITGLLAMGHFADIQQLTSLFQTSSPAPATPIRQTK